MIGQMMEGVVLPPEKQDLPKRDWTVGHAAGRQSRHITSLDLVPESLEAKTRARFQRYTEIKQAQTRFEALDCGPDAELILTAYGTSARVALGAKKLAEHEGLKLGLFRPLSLWPFPDQALAAAAKGKPVLTVEMSLGQYVEDVRLAVAGAAPVHLLGHCGGVIPTEEEVFIEAKRIVEEHRRRSLQGSRT
jgi:2-oxoglutarate ferredoxin oxidoreductase subunit alpha